jgi:hypothetical protein
MNFPLKVFEGAPNFFVVLQVSTLIIHFYFETLGTPKIKNMNVVVFIGYICKFNFGQKISLDKM